MSQAIEENSDGLSAMFLVGQRHARSRNLFLGLFKASRNAKFVAIRDLAGRYVAIRHLAPCDWTVQIH